MNRRLQGEQNQVIATKTRTLGRFVPVTVVRSWGVQTGLPNSNPDSSSVNPGCPTSRSPVEVVGARGTQGSLINQ